MMNIEKLNNINKIEAEVFFAQTGRLEEVVVEKLSRDLSLWNRTMDIQSQLGHIANDASFLGFRLSEMLTESIDNHGREIIMGKPPEIPEEANPVFDMINAYMYFMEDLLSDFYRENMKNKTDEKEEEKLEVFRDRFGLSSQSHDSHWSLGFGKQGQKTTFPNFKEIKGRMVEFFDWEDFVTPVRKSEKYEGELVYDFFGKEIEYGDIDNKEAGEMLFEKFVDFAREKNSNTSSIQSSLSENPDTKSEITLPMKV